MPVYEYTALDNGGKLDRGVVEADGPGAARRKMRGAGLFPVELTDIPPADAGFSARSISLSSIFSRVGPAETAVLTRQLATLLGSGISLVAALDALMDRSGNRPLIRVIARIKGSVTEGNSLASALSLHPQVFSPMYVNMVRAGEETGSLEPVLERLADFSETQRALANRFRAALAYPVLMTLTGTVILLFLIAFVVPGIADVFIEMGQALPLPTTLLIGAAHFLQSFWWLLIGAVSFAAVGLSRATRTGAGRRLADKFRLRAPFIGGLNGRLAMVRFGRTLASLLRSGVPVLKALGIVRDIIGNTLITETIDHVILSVGRGSGLALPLSGSRWFPPMAVQMIAVGEQTGELESMLDRIADAYQREAENRLMALIAMMEPVMILAMGIVVGFIVVSILLPIFEMNLMVG